MKKLLMEKNFVIITTKYADGPTVRIILQKTANSALYMKSAYVKIAVGKQKTADLVCVPNVTKKFFAT